jgi:hypothetical protein
MDDAIAVTLKGVARAPLAAIRFGMEPPAAVAGA